MNCKFIKKTKGAIAVFLTLIMLGMVVFEGVLIDSSRIIAAKSVVSGAGDLALNSALTNYDKVLYEVYGLFATAKDEADLQVKINDYFNKTIQGAGIDASIDDISNMLNLVVSSGGSVSLTGVPGSELTNSDVIGNQILEYMKFRAPVNIGFGFLEKIDSFSDFNKQTEAMESQMDFEEKLESLQDALQNVYDKANDLKKFDNENPIKSFEKKGSELSDPSIVFPTAVKNYSELKDLNPLNGKDIVNSSKYINGNNENPLAWSDEDYKNLFDIGAVTTFLTGEDRHDESTNRGKEYKIAYAELCNKYESVVNAQNAICAEGANYWDNSSLFNNYYSALKLYVETCENNLDKLQQLYTLLSKYEVWYTKCGEADEGKKEENLNFYNSQSEKIKQIKKRIEDMSIENVWQSNLDSYQKKVWDLYDLKLSFVLSELYNNAESGKDYADKLKKAIDCGSHKDKEICCLAKAISDTESAKNEWQNKISSLPDGSTKTSMQGTFDGEAKGIDSGQYQEILNIASSAKDYYEKVSNYAKDVKLKGKNNTWTIYNTYSVGVNCDDVYNLSKETDALIEKGIFPAGLSENITPQIDNDKFYQYLKNICSDSEDTGEEGNKKEAKEVRDKLFDKGNDTSCQNADDSDIGKVDAAQWANVESVFSSGDGDDIGSNTVNKGGKNSETTKNAKDTLNSTKSLLSNIGNILLSARDGIYYTEYATGMFSCYTTGLKQKEGEDSQIFTIAGNDPEYNLMSKDYNRMWRAEQEYILWGNQDSAKNVNNTLALIFGIRFALNLLYAFTGDAEIEITTLSWATAIAGWTGFGVPIVQTVLKIALALAETTCDLVKLKNGEDVVLYKTNTTWVMKPSGMTKATVETVADTAADVAVDAVDNAFNYVDKVTTENINKVASGVANTIEETQKSIVDSAVNYVMAPFGKTFVALVGQTEGDINNSLNDVLTKLKADVSNDNSALGQLENFLLEDYGTRIVSEISAKVSEAKGDATKKYEEMVKDLKNKLISAANGSDIVKNLGTELSGKVHDTLQTVNDDTKEAVGETVSNSVSNFLNEAQGYGDGKSASVTRGFAITMNYEEYVHMFLLLYGASKEKQETYLSRIAQLIQLNMSMEKRRGSSFTLANSYTMLQIDAKVDVNTFFFGKLNSFLDNPVDAKSKYTLDYRSLQGY